MARRRTRAAARWGTRIPLAIFAGLMGLGAVDQALAYHLRSSNIEQAYILAQWDGRITALLAQKLSGPEASPATRVTADRLAKRALLQDPTVSIAAATLGMNAQIRGATSGVRRLLAYAESLSRRDVQTEFWAIEDAVSRNDIAGALRHHDIALRTSKRAPDVLFPILAAAAAEPAVRAALIRTLAAKPPWGAAFVGYAAGNSPDPRVAAVLLRDVRRAGVVIPAGYHTALVNALVLGAHFDQAWSYYASIHPGVDRRRSRDPRFAGSPGDPSPFDWAAVNDVGISTSIQRGEQGGMFDFAVSPSVGGVLLRQMQLLPPGDYRFAGRGGTVDQSLNARPYWILACLNGRELGRLSLPGSASTSGRFSGRFTVPAGCPVQYLSLVARPWDGIGGISGRIEQALLGPDSLPGFVR